MAKLPQMLDESSIPLAVPPRAKRVLKAKTPRIEWTHEIAFTCCGARFFIGLNHEQLLEKTLRHLPPGARLIDPDRATKSPPDRAFFVFQPPPGSSPEVLNGVFDGKKPLAFDPDLARVLKALQSALHTAVAMHARTRLFVHAGVVGWRGRAIVIPGRSRSGKTSLVAALVKAGATYLSDEYAVFDERGRVWPYAKTLSVRQGDGTARLVSAQEIGGKSAVRSLPVGLVVVTKYDADAIWQPRPMSGGQAVLALFDNTVMARAQATRALPILRSVVLNAATLQSPRGDVDDMTKNLLFYWRQLTDVKTPK